MSTFNAATDCILSVLCFKNDTEQTRVSLVSTNLAVTLQEECDAKGLTAVSIHILNPKNFVFQPIAKSKLIEVLTLCPQYDDFNIAYLKEHPFFSTETAE